MVALADDGRVRDHPQGGRQETMSAAVDNVVDRLADEPAGPAHGSDSDVAGGAGLGAWPALLICLAATVIGLAPTFGYLLPAWWDSQTYSHGLLVAPLCVWLLWRQRRQIASAQLAPSAAALAMLACVVVLWMLSHAANVQVGVESLLPLAAGLAITAALGWDVARRVAFPIGFLYFAISIWDVINATLQSLTTFVVGLILKLVGVPAFIQGNTVQIPSGWFEVAGGCSGLHFFIVAGALASLYGHLYYRRLRTSLMLLGAGLAMALLVNWLRVATIITAGHLTEMRHYLVQVDHYTFGWVIFAVALVPFFILARRLEDEPGADRTASDAPPAAGQRRLVPVSRVMVVAGLALLPALVWGRLDTATTGTVDTVLPGIAGWDGPREPPADWLPRFSTPSGEGRASYRRDGRAVEVYVNWYERQAPGRELVGYGNRLEGDSGWRIESVELRESGAGQPHVDTLRETVLISDRHGRRLVWSWYVVGQTALTSPVRVKLLEAWRNLTGRYGSGVVALSTACAGQCVAAREHLEVAVRDLAGPLSRHYTTSER